MGPYKIYQEKRKLLKGEIPLEFFSLGGLWNSTSRVLTIKEDFILAEMGNALDYLSVMFGAYPYPVFRAAFHPFRFGQGFATMLAIPNADSSNPSTFAFLSHETSHQWWGNEVAWRSYRDQWLSEGFAEYSGILYIQTRTKKSGDVKDAINALRDSLKEPPGTTTGIGSKRVVDIGPLILGQRLRSRQSLNAYSILTYSKGALVLRMLHFLFTNPGTGEGQPFFDMMRAFIDRYRGSAASTEQFEALASEYFARTPIAQKYGVKDLSWFFSQWVNQTALPSYRLEYSIQGNPDGSASVEGTVFQENAPKDWAMPLPLLIKFQGNQVARGTVLALGPQNPVAIRLPQKPESVELDPEHWVLSDKTSTKKK
jgi:aminopeptidase N